MNGRTVKVEITGILPRFVAVNASILPVPESKGSPIVDSLCSHKYCVPLIKEPAKLIGPTILLLQILKLLMGSTLGVDFTSIVKDIGEPIQPKYEGVTVNILETGMMEKLLAMKALI